MLVSASVHHFATEGAVYRRPIDGRGAWVPMGDGLPRWLAGIVDTDCLHSRNTTVAVADHGGNLYVSADGGVTWTARASAFAAPSSVLII
jgi:photosystem II stability/assembly factor-like uncharacterized protein